MHRRVVPFNEVRSFKSAVVRTISLQGYGQNGTEAEFLRFLNFMGICSNPKNDCMLSFWAPVGGVKT